MNNKIKTERERTERRRREGEVHGKTERDHRLKAIYEMPTNSTIRTNSLDEKDPDTTYATDQK